jgi:hypothetical protein
MFTLKNCLAICEIGNCENYNIPIEVVTVNGGLVICGPCGTQISNINEIKK